MIEQSSSDNENGYNNDVSSNPTSYRESTDPHLRNKSWQTRLASIPHEVIIKGNTYT